MGSLQDNLLAENPDVAFDPVPAEALDFFDIRIGDTSLVREVEAQLGGGNERSSLVNVVSEDFSEGPVENMSSRVIIPEWPTT